MICGSSAGLPIEAQLVRSGRIIPYTYSYTSLAFMLADGKGQVVIIKLQLDLSKEYGIVLEGGGQKALIR